MKSKPCPFAMRLPNDDDLVQCALPVGHRGEHGAYWGGIWHPFTDAESRVSRGLPADYRQRP